MKVLITGTSGLIGSALAKSLTAGGHSAISLQRQNNNPDSPVWDPENCVMDLARVRDIYAVVHLAGENIADGRWSETKKNRILYSRVRGTKLLVEYFANSNHKPQVIISASAVGFYGDRGAEIVDEDSKAGNGFLANVCVQWEDALKVAVEAGIRVIKVRFGTVLSKKGGVLKKMLLPFKLGLGGVFGSGEQYMSWVSIDDAVAMIQYVMTNDSLQGPVNFVTPNALNNRKFTKSLGQVLSRPTIFPLPAFAARIALGEMANELLLSSNRVYPSKLMKSGYKFLHPELNQALINLK
jgi:uncharacterized protein (TIGR01777 family)